jgi:hypothetical protein
VSERANTLVPVARELPIAGAPAERADARRNRQRILRAAAELVAERGLGEVRMEEVAGERRLQDSLLSGPPPLGPGAPPAERLRAFLSALLELTVANLDLLLISDYDSPGDRYRTGAYAAWRLHVSLLLEDAGYERGRAEGLAHAVLAPLAADLVRHRLRDEGADPVTLEAELDDLASVIGAHTNTRTRRRT